MSDSFIYKPGDKGPTKVKAYDNGDGTFSEVPGTSLVRVATSVHTLNQVAGTYTLLTATGDVYLQDAVFYNSVAAGGLTNIKVNDDNATPDLLLAQVLLAALTGGVNLVSNFVAPVLIPDGHKIRLVQVGDGNAGELRCFFRYLPASLGAVLS
jgi:hypothetical protein